MRACCTAATAACCCQHAYCNTPSTHTHTRRSPAHASLLFRRDSCLRWDAEGCAPEGSAWYAVTHAGVDPMLRRSVEEASLLARDNASAITPDDANTR